MVHDRLLPQPCLVCPSQQAMNWMVGAKCIVRTGRPAPLAAPVPSCLCASRTLCTRGWQMPAALT
eukprot:11627643-Prorocentrum_lima.AAC.1